MDVDLGAMVRDNRCIGIQLKLRGDRILSRQGLTGVQARALLYILVYAAEGASLTELHRELNISMAAASGLVKRLRDKGYIRVEACRLDERRKLLYATEKGLRVREAMDASLRAIPVLLYKGFTEEELVLLDRLQKKMLENLSAPETESNLEGSSL